mmetsp:Transcript_38002/g.119941  ORF Transcript_38002/g.119941 Transcript_38002/m.119941 type:complete len:290 (+) Transcript_38002:2169-3038(+)
MHLILLLPPQRPSGPPQVSMRKLRARGERKLRGAYSSALEKISAVEDRVGKASFVNMSGSADGLRFGYTADAMRAALREHYVRGAQGFELPGWGGKGVKGRGRSAWQAVTGAVSSAMETTRLVAFLPQPMLVEHGKQLAYLLEVLADAKAPIVAASWQDTVDAWVALRDLLGQVQAGRAQVILESIFAEDSVSRALAMGQALSNMDGGAEDVPASVLNKLKADLGGHIKSNYYTYRRAIEKEIALIDRLMEYKQRAFAIAGSAILALFIAIGNFCAFIFSRYVTGQWSP